MQDIAGYVEQHAGHSPSKTAITCNGEHITYAQLSARSRSAAAVLAERGAVPGDVVAILCERDIDLIVCMLAVLRLGCIYLPVDKLNPAPRLNYILSNSNTRLVITDEPTLPIASDCPQISLHDLMQGVDVPCVPQSPPDGGFCIMYTSGTTGKPKGTLLPWSGVHNHLLAKIDCVSMTEHSVVAQNAGYYFVNSIWQIFSPLVVGASLVIYDRHAMADMHALLQRIQQDRISIFQAVPTFWSRFFDAVLRQGAAPAGLRCIVSTSEKLTYSLVKTCYEALPGIRLVNAYGQTECSDDVLHYTMDALPAGPDIPIGTPVPNTRIYIIGDDHRPCPPGERGEICAAGVGLARGYLRAPEQTALAFVRGSSLGLDEPLLYRTGDIGYRRADGNIVYCGRKDFQVKINGFRVELYEIEKVLQQYPAITQAAVICCETGDAKRLVAYYSAAEAVAPAELEQHLRSLLPGYMIPPEYIRLTEFPLTAMEKIDRKQLLANWQAAHAAP